jgi:hypothetical protein
VVLSNNLVFSKWEQIFKDPMTTAAAIDRLIHYAVIVELNISSFRLEEAQRNQKSRTDSKESKPRSEDENSANYAGPILLVAKG